MWANMKTASLAFVAITALTSTVAALPVLGEESTTLVPVLSTRDTNISLPANNSSLPANNSSISVINSTLSSLNMTHPCNASCVHSLVRKTSYASAAVGVALTMLEYKSIDWCHSKDNVGWCPPTIQAVLDTISVNIAGMVPKTDTSANHCDRDCLRGKLELASRRAATASMLWAKHKVSGGIVWDVNSTVGPDKIDWAIRLLAPNDNLTQELKNDTASTEKRSVLSTLMNMFHESQPKPKSIEPRGHKSAPTDPTANSRKLWEPRMKYLLSAPSRLRHDNWLAILKVRNHFNDVLQAVDAADHFELESSWMKYMMREWMHGPPTREPKQYVDWWGFDFTGKTLPVEALQKLRGLTVNETVWRWVEDFDSAKVMDPWEGRPDSANPNVLLRGYQMQFQNETSTEPCYKTNGKLASSTDNAPSAVIRSSWPFERSLGQGEALFRMPHTWPWSGARKWEYLGISPPPDGSRIWSILSGKDDRIETSASNGGIQGIPVVLLPGSNRPQSRYLGPTFLWGDQYLGNDAPKPWCDNRCFTAVLRKMNNAAARAAVYAVVTVYKAQNWCATANKINVAAIVDDATRAGVSYGAWRGQSCLTSDCQYNVSQAANLRTEIAAMVLTKKLLLPHLAAFNSNANISGMVVDSAIASSLKYYKNITDVGKITATGTSNLTDIVYSNKVVTERGLEPRSPPSSMGQLGGPKGSTFTRFWRSMLGKMQKIMKVLKHDLILDDANLGEVEWGELEQMSKYIDSIDMEQPARSLENWLEQTRTTAEGNPNPGLEAPEAADVEELATWRITGAKNAEGKYIADENLKGWTDSELGWPEEWELRANQVEIVEEDDAFDYWKTWDELRIEQRLEGHLREPTVEELEADEAHAASPPETSTPDEYAPRPPADQVNVEPAEWKPQPRFPMRNYPPGDISEAEFTLDGAADIDAAYSPKWSPDEQFGTEIEQIEKPGMKISGNPNPTPEEFEEAYKNDDPVAKAQMEDYKIQSPSGLPGSADEVAEEAGIPEEVAEELVEDGSIEVFAEEAVVGVVEGVMDFMILL